MDIKGLFRMPGRSAEPAFEGDPGQAPSTREFDIASSATEVPGSVPASAAAELSPMALVGAGLEAPDATTSAESQPAASTERQGIEFEPDDLVKHILGKRSDRRLDTVRQQIRRSRPRRAAA